MSQKDIFLIVPVLIFWEIKYGCYTSWLTQLMFVEFDFF